MKNRLNKIDTEIKTTKSKTYFAFKFARLSLLNGVYDLIDFTSYLKIEVK